MPLMQPDPTPADGPAVHPAGSALTGGGGGPLAEGPALTGAAPPALNPELIEPDPDCPGCSGALTAGAPGGISPHPGDHTCGVW